MAMLQLSRCLFTALIVCSVYGGPASRRRRDAWFLANGVNDIFDNVYDTADDVFDTYKDRVDDVSEKVKEFVEDCKDKISDVISAAKDGLSSETDDLDIVDDVDDDESLENDDDTMDLLDDVVDKDDDSSENKEDDIDNNAVTKDALSRISDLSDDVEDTDDDSSEKEDDIVDNDDDSSENNDDTVDFDDAFNNNDNIFETKKEFLNKNDDSIDQDVDNHDAISKDLFAQAGFHLYDDFTDKFNDVIPTELDDEEINADLYDDIYENVFDNLYDDLYDDIDDEAPEIIDGIDTSELLPEELEGLLEDLDNEIIYELDVAMLKSAVKTRDDMSGEMGHRRKRWVPLAAAAARVAFSAGRSLFSGSARVGRATWKATKKGDRIRTQQYDRRGDFSTAQRDFNRFKPTDRSDFTGGSRGMVGKHEVKVRSNSSGGQPTLEVRSPRSDGTTHVRKFRYNN